MKYRNKICILLLFILLPCILSAQLTNTITWSNSGSSAWRSTNVITDYYKYLILAINYNGSPLIPLLAPGENVDIDVVIFNAGSIATNVTTYFSNDFNTATNTTAGLAVGLTRTNTFSFTVGSNITSFITRVSNVAFGYSIVTNITIPVFNGTNQVHYVTDKIYTLYTNNLINGFSNTGKLGDVNAFVRMRVGGIVPAGYTNYLFYSVNTYGGTNIPDFNDASKRARFTNAGGGFWGAMINYNDPDIVPGKYITFGIMDSKGNVWYIGGNAKTNQLAGLGITGVTNFWTYYVEEYGPQDSAGDCWEIFPNYGELPLSSAINITYTIRESSHVNIIVYNLRGEIIKKIINESMPVGRYSAQFYGKNEYGNNIAPGLYFLHIETSGCSDTKKLIFIKRR